jgi:nitrate reductase assembly molybdenum cofactor insertion protein NarJ
MSSAPAPSPELLQHLDRAAEWRLLSQILSYPGSGWKQRVEMLLECIRNEPFSALGRAALQQSSPELWMRLFGPAGCVHARAVTWEGGLQPGYLLAALSAFYEAFGYETPADAAPDQLPVLLDFIAWLELKLAYACVRQDSEAVEVTARALETFLGRYVTPAAWPVFRQLESVGPDFFCEAARLAAERAGPEPEARAWTPDAWPGGAPLEDDSCGAPQNFVQIQPGSLPRA